MFAMLLPAREVADVARSLDRTSLSDISVFSSIDTPRIIANDWLSSK